VPDRVAARVAAYAQAFLEIARVDGPLPGVEDDLFRFARTLAISDDLRVALTDPQLPLQRRIAVIEELMGNKALDTSTALVAMVVAANHAADLGAIVEQFVELAAAERLHEVAEVRSAIPLDDDQQARLAAALGAATGKDVEVKVVIDPSVLGGLIARIGDTVIDGSVRHRLEQLKETL
jgi:F-type H+-transporting ATPase subunit delta